MREVFICTYVGGGVFLLLWKMEKNEKYNIHKVTLSSSKDVRISHISVYFIITFAQGMFLCIKC